VRWLEGYIATYPGSVFIISHEGDFIDATCERIIDVDETKLNSYTGNYSGFPRAKEANRTASANAYERQQRIRAPAGLHRPFRRQSDQSPRCQITRESHRARREIEAPRANIRKISLEFPEAVQSSQEPLRLRKLTVRYGDKTVLDNVDFKLKRETASRCWGQTVSENQRSSAFSQESNTPLRENAKKAAI
jgi:ATP-binding cassette subfamily F protein 3